MKRLTSLFLLLVICTLPLTACFGDGAAGQSKIFIENGMSIKLTDHFKKTTVEGYTVAYQSSTVTVLALREAFATEEGLKTLTPAAYGEKVLHDKGLSDLALQSDAALTWFEHDFEDTALQSTCHSFCYIFKTADAFWQVQFSCLAADADTYRPIIATYARSIAFT